MSLQREITTVSVITPIGKAEMNTVIVVITTALQKKGEIINTLIVIINTELHQARQSQLILGSSQPHSSVTSGRITHSNFFYTSSKHKSLSHKFVYFTVTTSNTIIDISSISFGSYLYSVVAHLGNLLKSLVTMLKSLVTMSRVTATGPHGKIALAKTNAVKKQDQNFEKKRKKRRKMNRPGR